MSKEDTVFEAALDAVYSKLWDAKTTKSSGELIGILIYMFGTVI